MKEPAKQAEGDDRGERSCPDAGVLWQGFRGKLQSFLRRRLPRPEDIDDVLQEVFLKIHRERCALEDGEHVEAWVYRIARNAVADFYRARGRRPADQPGEDVAMLENWPEVLSSDTHETVLSWLEPMTLTLAPKYRDALQLADFEGLSQREVADRLGLSLSGAKSRVQRARVQLGVALQDCCRIEFGGDGRVSTYSSNRCEPEGCDKLPGNEGPC